MNDIQHDSDRLVSNLKKLNSCAVAFSGGVDSAVVAMAARLALAESAVAVTAVSPSLASGELENAQKVARQIGIRHQIVNTLEYENEKYRENANNRCYFCKSELYGRILDMREELGVEHIVNGTNVDDLGDYRPGLQAADENRVHSPLVECQISKARVRNLAKLWDLPVWDKPASPCLSSRIAYGEEVTIERLRMVDQAESWLRTQGIRNLRVRYHRGDLARIELEPNELPRMADPQFCKQVDSRLKQLGFRFVTLDLTGFRSGSMNDLLGIELPGE